MYIAFTELQFTGPDRKESVKVVSLKYGFMVKQNKK